MTPQPEPTHAEMVLDEIRRLLRDGATIRITDPEKPVLELLPDGSCNGNLTIDYPQTK